MLHQNGNITGYLIQYQTATGLTTTQNCSLQKSTNVFELAVTATTLTVSINVDIAVELSVRVAAMTSAGQGPFSDCVFLPGLIAAVDAFSLKEIPANTQTSSSVPVQAIALSVGIGGGGLLLILVLGTMAIVTVIMNRRARSKSLFKDIDQLMDTATIPDDLKHYEIDSRDLKIFNQLGEGLFGTVFKAVYTQNDGTQVEVAIKALYDQSNPELKSAFVQEASRMSRFNHSNIVKLVGVCFEPNMIVQELMHHGDLRKYLQFCYHSSVIKLRSSKLLKLSIDVVSGFQYLSEIGFVHRDLAARNILLNDQFVAKIGDFGLSRSLYHSDVCP